MPDDVERRKVEPHAWLHPSQLEQVGFQFEDQGVDVRFRAQKGGKGVAGHEVLVLADVLRWVEL